MDNKKKFLEIISNICSIKSKEMNMSLKINNIKKWDSIANIRIIIEIEKVFKKKLEPKDLIGIVKLSDLYNKIK